MIVGSVERQALIARIEELRQSTVICFVTSLRPNVGAQMGDDAVRVFLDHLLRLPHRPVERLDLFLCSNGGSGTIPWRLVSLFREFAVRFGVLIPYRAYSAATLIALGADEIVMHPFGELGPIDSTVTNAFNPIDPATGQRQGISVEDVTSYINFVKSTVGITHEDELVEAVKILAEKVHPLALGNVERFLLQSRMIARRILKTHMREEDSHIVEEIVENMVAKLYFHGHPISRQEAAKELRLKVAEEVPAELEEAMWRLYLDYEEQLEHRRIFDPAADMAALLATPPATPAHADLPGDAGGQRGAPQRVPSRPPPPRTYTLIQAVVESAGLSSTLTARRRSHVADRGERGQALVRIESLGQEWADHPL